jgi:hypothetical protein
LRLILAQTTARRTRGEIERDRTGRLNTPTLFKSGKQHPGFRPPGWGISTLVFQGVGQTRAGAVKDFDTEAAPKVAGFCACAASIYLAGHHDQFADT